MVDKSFNVIFPTTDREIKSSPEFAIYIDSLPNIVRLRATMWGKTSASAIPNAQKIGFLSILSTSTLSSVSSLIRFAGEVSIFCQSDLSVSVGTEQSGQVFISGYSEVYAELEEPTLV